MIALLGHAALLSCPVYRLPFFPFPLPASLPFLSSTPPLYFTTLPSLEPVHSLAHSRLRSFVRIDCVKGTDQIVAATVVAARWIGFDTRLDPLVQQRSSYAGMQSETSDGRARASAV